ncbi:hypothetical protein [Azospirillum sp. ST 5-10]
MGGNGREGIGRNLQFRLSTTLNDKLDAVANDLVPVRIQPLPDLVA